MSEIEETGPRYNSSIVSICPNLEAMLAYLGEHYPDADDGEVPGMVAQTLIRKNSTIDLGFYSKKENPDGSHRTMCLIDIVGALTPLDRELEEAGFVEFVRLHEFFAYEQGTGEYATETRTRQTKTLLGYEQGEELFYQERTRKDQVDPETGETVSVVVYTDVPYDPPEYEQIAQYEYGEEDYDYTYEIMETIQPTAERIAQWEDFREPSVKTDENDNVISRTYYPHYFSGRNLRLIPRSV